MKPWIPLVIFACFLASCSNGLRIEKRHYSSGFYVHSHSRSHTAKDSSTVPTITAAQEQTAVTDPVEIVQPAETTIPLIPGDTVQVSAEQKESVQEEPQVIPASDQVTVTPEPGAGDERPVEGKRMEQMFWAALILLGLAVLFSVFSFTSFLGFLGIGTSLFALIGIALDIWVMATSSERRRWYAKSDPETSAYYDKWRKRSIILLVCFLSLVLLALLLLIAILLLFVYR